MSRFRLNGERAVWNDIDGEAVIINTDTSVYYSLNRSGTAVLRQIARGPCSVAGLAGYVSQAYGIAPETATAAVRALLGELQAEGLLDATTRDAEEPHRGDGEPASGPWEPPTLTRHGELERLVLSGE
jgi:hypothetical protein